MSQIQQSIGRLPTFKGPYVDGSYYKRLHRVTHLGSEFQAKVDGTLREPVTLSADGQDYTINTDQWDCVSNGTDALIIANTVNRVYTLTETRWAELQADILAFDTFCKSHKGWAVDVVEDGYVAPEPEPTPEGGSTIAADGTLALDAVINADGVLSLNATIAADGTLSL